MLTKIQDTISKNLSTIANYLAIAVIISWLISNFVPTFQTWLLDKNVFILLVLILLVELIKIVFELNGNINQFVTLYPDQASSSERLLETISNSSSSKAQIVGLTAGKREEILSALIRKEWQIQLLIQHPDSAMNEILKAHLEEKIQELTNVTFINYSNVELRLYKRPCFLRGLKLGEVGVSVGWYACGEGAYEFFGHNNPLLVVKQGSPDYKTIKDFFNLRFDYLWGHEETISLEEYNNSQRS